MPLALTLKIVFCAKKLYCFVWFFHRTANIHLNNITCMVIVIKKEYIYCEVRTHIPCLREFCRGYFQPPPPYQLCSLPYVTFRGRALKRLVILDETSSFTLAHITYNQNVIKQWTTGLLSIAQIMENIQVQVVTRVHLLGFKEFEKLKHNFHISRWRFTATIKLLTFRKHYNYWHSVHRDTTTVDSPRIFCYPRVRR